MNTYVLLGIVVIGIVSFLVLILLLILFGSLIWLQFRIWLLAKKGFHLVEHIGTDKVRRYFYLKPKDNKFDFKSGFYAHYPETTTKIGEGVLKKLDKTFFEGVKKGDETIDDGEYDKLKDTVSKMVYNIDAVTLRWGIPTITYVGNDPFPVNFNERSKEYTAQLFRDIYLRILATLQNSWMRKVVMYGIIALGIIAVLLLLHFLAYRSTADSLAVCSGTLNSTINSYMNCMNSSFHIVSQSSGMMV